LAGEGLAAGGERLGKKKNESSFSVIASHDEQAIETLTLDLDNPRPYPF
jgi:hypothetical protein